MWPVWAGCVMLPYVKIAWHRGISPFGLRRVITLTAPGARRAETVIKVWIVPRRYSRNYGYYGLPQWRNVPRGLHYSRPQNNAKNEISMSYGIVHGDNPMCVKLPRESCYPRESRILPATCTIVTNCLCAHSSAFFVLLPSTGNEHQNNPFMSI